jgi:segregation and condensation protein B
MSDGQTGDAPGATQPLSALARHLAAMLFASPEPVATADLAQALERDERELDEARAELAKAFAEGRLGIVFREVAGGWTLASEPEAEPSVRALLAKPRTPPLTQAQAECLAITAYLQPVSRPEIARIRGVNSDSAMSTLEERGLIEERGRSQFGAILYRTTPLFEKLFGLESLRALPDVETFAPGVDEAEQLREKLLKAGEQRAS